VVAAPKVSQSSDAVRQAEAGDPVHDAGPRLSKAMEDEVNGSLGALLGMLEVLSIDVDEPLSARQQAIITDTLRFGDNLRASVEALMILLSDADDPRFARSNYALRRLVDHAVRAAAWSAQERKVVVQLPESGAWDNELVHVDAGRVDRALRAMTDALVARVGAEGTVQLEIERLPHAIRMTLTGRPASPAGALSLPRVLIAAWQRLFALQGGQLQVDLAGRSLRVDLPVASPGEKR
jgi:K+-sensing histidine kinase KdpD